MSRNSLITLVVLVFGFLSSPGRTETAPVVALRQLEVEQQVTLAGALDLQALGALAGTRAVVIDLTQTGEFAETEAARVTGLGLGYHKVPVDGVKLERDQLRQIAAILATNDDRPVIMHCASGNRAAMVWAAVQLDSGANLDAVLERVDALVTHAAIADAIRAYAVSVPGPAAN
jgi:uncharacterized protein (TIGR01244 family)